MTAIPSFPRAADFGSESFLLQRVQPGLSGLMDGALSTLAPIFAVVLATHQPLTAFYTGIATALGAGVSMAFSEGLSDTGELTGRGSPVLRGAITGGGTFLGGVFHTLPFLIPSYQTAIVAAIVIVAILLFAAMVLAIRLKQPQTHGAITVPETEVLPSSEGVISGAVASPPDSLPKV